VCAIAAGLGLLLSCSDSTIASKSPTTLEPSTRDGSGLSTQFKDNAGRFEISFPGEPTKSEKTDRSATLAAQLVTIEVRTDDQIYAIAYSDAPIGVALEKTQVLPETVARENASRDKGELVNVRTTTLFGRPALEYEVAAADGSSRYFDINVVLGGRRYELTVTQRGEDRHDFDEFVRSFHILEPPLATGADFFAAAEKLCASLASNRKPRPANETPTQHADAIKALVDDYEGMTKTLSAPPATAEAQGDAAALIDAIRRSLPSGRAYVEAIRSRDPKADELSRAANPDLEYAESIAKRRRSPSCP
jgi:hypothetical protein